MTENGESSFKSIKRKHCKVARSKSSQPVIWSDDEKLQLAEAIDMYGINFPKRLVTRVPTKNLKQVKQKLAQLRVENRKEIEEMKKCPSFIDLNEMDDLFLVSGTKPEDVMIKWMDYLQENYDKEPNSFNTFKLLSSSFLILSECTPPPKTTGPDIIDLRNVYYYLYRVFNNYHIGKQHGDTRMKNYLHQMFLRVMEEIKLTSDEEKVTMYKIVSNWTVANKSNSLRVYGKKNEIKTEQTQESANTGIKPNSKIAPEFKVLENPMIPSFNPFQIKSKKSL